MNFITKFALAALVAGFSTLAAADSIKVLNEDNQPVANAIILLGFEKSNPFPGNELKTGNDGLTGVPTDWKAALPVTVQAAGYVTTTIPVLLPGEHTIYISRTEGNLNLEVAGMTQNFGRLITDGKVDFGMVIPAISRENMLSFDIGSIMSPQNDTIEIIGNSIDIPSNVTLPNQTENYIFPITLDKPAYRSYLREKGTYQMFAMRGQFPLKKVVDDIRGGKSIFEVINHFTFIGSGQKSVVVNNNVKNADIDVAQTAFNAGYNVKAPNFATDKVMLSLALSEKNSMFVPTDLKRLTPNQSLTLKTNATLGAGYNLSILVDEATNIEPADTSALRELNPLTALANLPFGQQEPRVEPIAKSYNFSKMTFTMNPVGATVTPKFLPMVDKPTISGNIMKMNVPALSAGLTPAAMYLVLTEIESLGSGSMKSERRTRLWEVWSSGWLPQVEMPKITFQKNPNRKYRWEAMFLARPSTFVFEAAPTDRVDLNQITHVTRNAMDL
jgi:hypothetical protein